LVIIDSKVVALNFVYSFVGQPVVNIIEPKITPLSVKGGVFFYMSSISLTFISMFINDVKKIKALN